MVVVDKQTQNIRGKQKKIIKENIAQIRYLNRPERERKKTQNH